MELPRTGTTLFTVLFLCCFFITGCFKKDLYQLKARFIVSGPVTPQSLSVDSAGNIYILYTNGKIEKRNATGKILFTYQEQKPEKKNLKGPVSIRATSNGEVYVADTLNSRIVKYDNRGKVVQVFGSCGVLDSQFTLPADIYITQNGDLLISDMALCRLQRFTARGDYLLRFGTKGDKPGLFYKPAGLSIDEWGSVFVADMGNKRIQKLSEYGEVEPYKHRIKSGNIQLTPYRVRVRKGYLFSLYLESPFLWIFEGNEVVQKICVGKWKAGTKKTALDLELDGAGNLYILEKKDGNHGISIYQSS
ncbi:NHL repeat-containing protein [Candidatus Riflebacteria bacterium]